jgi:hypothetical protein
MTVKVVIDAVSISGVIVGCGNSGKDPGTVKDLVRCLTTAFVIGLWPA